MSEPCFALLTGELRSPIILYEEGIYEQIRSDCIAYR